MTVSLTVNWLYCGPHAVVVMGVFATWRELASVWTMLQILGPTAELLCSLPLVAAEEG